MIPKTSLKSTCSFPKQRQWFYIRLCTLFHLYSHWENCRTPDIYRQYRHYSPAIFILKRTSCLAIKFPTSRFFNFLLGQLLRKIQPFEVGHSFSSHFHHSEQHLIVTASLKVNILPDIDFYILFKCIFWSFDCNILPYGTSLKTI